MSINSPHCWNLYPNAGQIYIFSTHGGNGGDGGMGMEALTKQAVHQADVKHDRMDR